MALRLTTTKANQTRWEAEYFLPTCIYKLETLYPPYILQRQLLPILKVASERILSYVFSRLILFWFSGLSFGIWLAHDGDKKILARWMIHKGMKFRKWSYVMNALYKIICKNDKSRHHVKHIIQRDGSDGYAQRRANNERRLECEKVRVQLWLPEV